ncbi:MAG: hypothetical protein HQM14_06235 [SAR324 cluster bacterium]|nr:hypothetical protein [SAR324 cluster bacterium]
MEKSIEYVVISGLAGIVLAPIVLWIRKKLGLGKSKVRVVVTCPHCHADIGLDKLRNYICGSCNVGVAFFNLQTGKPHKDAEFYDCPQCGESNFKGVKFCIKCGTKTQN